MDFIPDGLVDGQLLRRSVQLERKWTFSGGEECGAGLVEVCGGLGGVVVSCWSFASHPVAPSAMECHGAGRVQQEPGVSLRQA